MFCFTSLSSTKREHLSKYIILLKYQKTYLKICRENKVWNFNERFNLKKINRT